VLTVTQAVSQKIDLDPAAAPSPEHRATQPEKRNPTDARSYDNEHTKKLDWQPHYFHDANQHDAHASPIQHRKQSTHSLRQHHRRSSCIVTRLAKPAMKFDDLFRPTNRTVVSHNKSTWHFARRNLFVQR
jgi:hypothetical protein